MQLFINERSFCGQFHDRPSLQGAVARFLRLVTRARKALERRAGGLWRSERLELRRALQHQDLRASLNHLGKDVYEDFRSVLYDKASPTAWEPVRLHDAEVLYEWQRRPDPDEPVKDSSMAELAERRLQDGTLLCCLLNLDGSPLEGCPSIVILKEQALSISLDSVCAEREFESWLGEAGEVPEYTEAATEPPRDEQTCLVDRIRFERTSRVDAGRTVYRHRMTGQFWYVDNLHFGRDAQIEVFDKHGRHIGEASLDGTIRKGTKDRTKTLTL